ncbi:hypothetical protein [Roseovarius sp. ZX-A-9]|uniref:hypothetical protein n=1 Tax=Roseovarius sp. ZX-A-9 TaxID=3014783 RepID=UPI00232B9156|nr:hypothetical protein [Roseovarius sp. ZX-A-9]
MKLKKPNAIYLFLRSRAKAKMLFAELALSGLRRHECAGALYRFTKAKTRTHICEFVDDGCQGNILIRQNERTRETGRKNIGRPFMATFQGLWLNPKIVQVKLFECASIDKRAYQKGGTDLGAAQLVITVLPHYNSEVFNPWVCIFEIRMPNRPNYLFLAHSEIQQKCCRSLQFCFRFRFFHCPRACCMSRLSGKVESILELRDNRPHPSCEGDHYGQRGDLIFGMPNFHTALSEHY